MDPSQPTMLLNLKLARPATAITTTTTTTTTFIFLLVLLTTFNPTSTTPDTTFIYGGCSDIRYDDDSEYESKINSLFSSLLSSSSLTPYNHFSLTSPSISALYQCRSDLSITDCATCVRSAVANLPHYCYHSTCGTLHLSSCHVRYGNDSFLGQPDRTFVLKKCGPLSGRYDSDLLTRRDEVLSGLAAGNALFRSGNVGYLTGMAQCEGDISRSECAGCVADAADRLQAGCGPSSWGDLYLAKCYVRYSAGGVYLSNANKFVGFWAWTLSILMWWVW